MEKVDRLKCTEAGLKGFARLALSMVPAGAIAAAGVLLAAHTAVAAPFPSAPIKLVVPYPPGGATDTIGRQIAAEIGKRTNEPVIVENRPGAAGIIGVGEAIRSAPDGYTLVLTSNSIVAVDPEQEKMPFDPHRDLVPIAAVVSIPYVIVANPSFAPNTIAELLAAAKKEPGKINFASSGIGGIPHMATELLMAMGGVDMKHIPYKGAVPAFTDVAGGRVQFMTGDVSTAMPYIQSGRLKALATTGRKRLANLPSVPTVDESGLPGYDAEGWFGVFAPAKTPADVVATLTQVVQASRQSPAFTKAMTILAGQVMDMSQPDFTRFIATETKKRADLIKSNHIVVGKDK